MVSHEVNAFDAACIKPRQYGQLTHPVSKLAMRCCHIVISADSQSEAMLRLPSLRLTSASA
ncbi:hypothetical protein J6590_013630 [Homalodisca vitripennis]|nr:hypothetical protein J6590_013630 [Homalodisca vitripennis]